jgi:hypothetical protein
MYPRSLLHRGIFQDRRALLPVEKFTDKGATDIDRTGIPKRLTFLPKPITLRL